MTLVCLGGVDGEHHSSPSSRGKSAESTEIAKVLRAKGIDATLALEVNIPLTNGGVLIQFRDVTEWKLPSMAELNYLRARVHDDWMVPFKLKQQDIVRATGLGAPYVCYLLKDPSSPNMNRRRRIEVFSVLRELFRLYDEGLVTEHDFMRVRDERTAGRWQSSGSSRGPCTPNRRSDGSDSLVMGPKRRRYGGDFRVVDGRSDVDEMGGEMGPDDMMYGGMHNRQMMRTVTDSALQRGGWVNAVHGDMMTAQMMMSNQSGAGSHHGHPHGGPSPYGMAPNMNAMMGGYDMYGMMTQRGLMMPGGVVDPSTGMITTNGGKSVVPLMPFVRGTEPAWRAALPMGSSNNPIYAMREEVVTVDGGLPPAMSMRATSSETAAGPGESSSSSSGVAALPPMEESGQQQQHPRGLSSSNDDDLVVPDTTITSQPSSPLDSSYDSQQQQQQVLLQSNAMSNHRNVLASSSLVNGDASASSVIIDSSMSMMMSEPRMYTSDNVSREIRFKLDALTQRIKSSPLSSIGSTNIQTVSGVTISTTTASGLTNGSGTLGGLRVPEAFRFLVTETSRLAPIAVKLQSDTLSGTMTSATGRARTAAAASWNSTTTSMGASANPSAAATLLGGPCMGSSAFPARRLVGSGLQIPVTEDELWSLARLRKDAEVRGWLDVDETGRDRWEGSLWLLWDMKDIGASKIQRLFDSLQSEYSLSENEIMEVSNSFLSQLVHYRDIELGFDSLLDHLSKQQQQHVNATNSQRPAVQTAADQQPVGAMLLGGGQQQQSAVDSSVEKQGEDLVRKIDINCELIEESIRVRDSFAWDLRASDWHLAALLANFVSEYKVPTSAISSLFIDLKMSILRYRKAWVTSKLEQMFGNNPKDITKVSTWTFDFDPSRRRSCTFGDTPFPLAFKQTRGMSMGMGGPGLGPGDCLGGSDASIPVIQPVTPYEQRLLMESHQQDHRMKDPLQSNVNSLESIDEPQTARQPHHSRYQLRRPMNPDQPVAATSLVTTQDPLKLESARSRKAKDSDESEADTSSSDDDDEMIDKDEAMSALDDDDDADDDDEDDDDDDDDDDYAKYVRRGTRSRKK